LFAFTGIRRAELSALDWGHIDFDRRQLKVEKGKGEKDRMVPLLPEIAEDLRCFKEHNRAGDNAPVFVGLHGKRLAPEAITAIFQRYVQKRVPNKSVTPHVLRATVATLLLSHGSDLFTISKILGHSRLETTKHYLRPDEQQLLHAMEKHPLNKQPVAVQLSLGI
jgi:site-specific recombinase XerD